MRCFKLYIYIDRWFNESFDAILQLIWDSNRRGTSALFYSIPRNKIICRTEARARKLDGVCCSTIKLVKRVLEPSQLDSARASTWVKPRACSNLFRVVSNWSEEDSREVDDYIRFKKTSQLTRSLSAMLMLDNWFNRTANLRIEVLPILFTRSSSPGFNVGLFTSKDTVTKNVTSVHSPSADKRLFPTDAHPQEPTCANSRYRFPGDAVKEFTTNDSGNRDSEQPRRYEHRYKK